MTVKMTIKYTTTIVITLQGCMHPDNAHLLRTKSIEIPSEIPNTNYDITDYIETKIGDFVLDIIYN